jgi:hypothetical protein
MIQQRTGKDFCNFEKIFKLDNLSQYFQQKWM